jgi:hypothetical protein
VINVKHETGVRQVSFFEAGNVAEWSNLDVSFFEAGNVAEWSNLAVVIRKDN